MILYVSPSRTSSQVAFVASRRVGGAVDRNRARRVMRAAWREIAPPPEPGAEVVLVARKTIQGAKTQDIVTEMRDLLRLAGLLAK